MSLILDTIYKTFAEPFAEVIKGISLVIGDGEFVAITGRSGSGKSTLLYMMSTLDLPSSGRVYYSDIDVQSLSERDIHRLRNEKIGFVFQFHYLLPDLNVLENVLMPTFKKNLFREKRAYALELLGHFDLAERMYHYPSQLSGGERQRVAIARALIMRPQYVFADEPTGALDSVNGEKVMHILEDLNKTLGATVVVVTHEPDFAARARRQIHLADGKIITDNKH